MRSAPWEASSSGSARGAPTPASGTARWRVGGFGFWPGSAIAPRLGIARREQRGDLPSRPHALAEDPHGARPAFGLDEPVEVANADSQPLGCFGHRVSAVLVLRGHESSGPCQADRTMAV